MKLRKGTMRLVLILSVSFAGTLAMVSSSCNRQSNTEQTFHYTGNVTKDGAMLAQHYCTGCHQLVPVNALTKDVWQYHVLPDMAPYMHLRSYMGGYFKPDTAQAGISLQDWSRIVSYYTTAAPDSLKKAKPPVPLLNDWAGFTLKTPEPAKSVPYTTMVTDNPYTHTLYTSDLSASQLTEWDAQLKPHAVATLPYAAVDALFSPKGDQVIISSIGVINVADYPNGRVLQANLKDGASVEPQSIATDLPRPVQTVEADFNKDGLTDYLVCGQGGKIGGVYLLKQTAKNKFDKQQISSMPGAVQAVTGDFNNDGWPDAMVLFGANNEGLYLFANNHSGGFDTKQLLKVPPVYGSTSFQLADMNHDGKPDLIYTCGYNFRDSRILKPYHGLYIFTNQGNWKFKQQYFYPINGCTKAVAEDFDGDGDLDIATIAFFADMKNHPAEEFVYFEQDKPFTFKPHAVPVSKDGHWMTMAVTDVNKDHQPDIVLGNYARGFIIQPDLTPAWSEKYPFIVLENHMKDHQAK